MNYLDIATLVIILWGFWTGVQRGLIRSLTSLIGWLLALVLGSRFAALAAPHFSILSEDPVVQKIAAFAVIVLVILTLTALVGHMLRAMLKAMALGIPERLAGGVFGAAKGTLVIMIAIQLFGPWVSESPYWHKSKVVNWFSPFAPMVVDFSRDVVEQAWDEAKQHDLGAEQFPHDASTNEPSNTEPGSTDTGATDASNIDDKVTADTVPNPFS